MNTMLKMAFAAVVGIAITATTAEAARRTYYLDYRGQEARSGQVAYLKRDIARTYGVDTRDFELLSVTAQVKSIDPSGWVYVRAGNSMSERRSVFTRPGDWINPADWSYDQLTFFGPFYDSWGEWTLEFQGRLFKLNRVTVEVEDNYYPRPPGPGPRPRPPGPRPRPGDRYVEVNCMSQNYQPAHCPVGFDVTDVVLLQQYSDARGACIAGRSYFVGQGMVTVSNGCRGRFGVYGR